MYRSENNSTKTGYKTNPRIKMNFKTGYIKHNETISTEIYNVKKCGGNLRLYQYPTHSSCIVAFFNGDAIWLIDKLYFDGDHGKKNVDQQSLLKWKTYF